MPRARRTLLALVAPLSLLVACQEDYQVPVDETDAYADSGDFTDSGVDAPGEMDASLEDPIRYDDPDFMPHVDRDFYEDGEPRSIPLGSSGAESSKISPSWIWKGESGSDRAGLAVANSGDNDGDGYEDIVVGSDWGSGTSGGDGAAYWNRGKLYNRDMNLGASKARFYGGTASKAGNAVGGGGDTNNDGYDDFLIGALTDSTAHNGAGAAYLVLGYTPLKHTLPSGAITITGESAWDRAGSAVDVVGDIDGDGNADMVVTSRSRDANSLSDSGAAYLIMGPVSADMDLGDSGPIELFGDAANDQLGQRVEGVGDVDGDGSPDFLVSARFADGAGSDAGAAYLVTSVPTADASIGATATATIEGASAGDNAGNSLAPAGDIDGDGYADFIVGALKYDGTGGAFLFTGPLTGTTNALGARTIFTGQKADDQFGADSCVADAAQDGVTDDVVITANRYGNTDKGAVYIFYSPDEGVVGAADADSRVVGWQAADYFGSSVDYVEDVNPFGVDVLLVGASNRGSSSKPQKGQVYIFKL